MQNKEPKVVSGGDDVNVSAYQSISDNSQFGKSPSKSKAWLEEPGVKELDWPTKSSDLSPIKHFRDEQREPGPLVQHRYLTSPIIFWMNGKNCHRNTGNTGNWTSLGHFTSHGLSSVFKLLRPP